MCIFEHARPKRCLDRELGRILSHCHLVDRGKTSILPRIPVSHQLQSLLRGVD
jgi:hypothetical protein